MFAFFTSNLFHCMSFIKAPTTCPFTWSSYSNSHLHPRVCHKSTGEVLHRLHHQRHAHEMQMFSIHQCQENNVGFHPRCAHQHEGQEEGGGDETIPNIVKEAAHTFQLRSLPQPGYFSPVRLTQLIFTKDGFIIWQIQNTHTTPDNYLPSHHKASENTCKDFVRVCVPLHFHTAGNETRIFQDRTWHPAGTSLPMTIKSQPCSLWNCLPTNHTNIGLP